GPAGRQDGVAVCFLDLPLGLFLGEPLGALLFLLLAPRLADGSFRRFSRGALGSFASSRLFLGRPALGDPGIAGRDDLLPRLAALFPLRVLGDRFGAFQKGFLRLARGAETVCKIRCSHAAVFTETLGPVESKNRCEKAGMSALRCKSASRFPADDAPRRPPPLTLIDNGDRAQCKGR